MPDNKEYIIDVAKRHTYYNQSREYQRLYQEWRTAENNPYGYKFVRDTREHIYVDGEGFIDNSGQEEETKALMNCFRLLGISLLIMAALSVVRILVLKLAFGLDNGGRVYYMTLENGNYMPSKAAYTMAALNILEYLLPIFFLSATAHLPRKVAMPIKRIKTSVYFSSVLVMLLIMCGGRTINMVYSTVLSKVSIATLYFDYIAADDPITLVICGFLQHVVIAVLIEVLYRGYMLQLFRQFGDMFAVILTSVVSIWMLQDFTQMAYLFIVSFFTGIITVRTGSIKPAVMMRLCARVLTFIITFVRSGSSEMFGEIFELGIMVAVFFGAVYYYKRMGRRSFKLSIGKDSTDMSMKAKFRLLIASAPVWCGFVSLLLMTILTVRVV